MVRDNLVGSSRRWGAEVCSPRSSPNRHRIGRPLCLENPNPARAEYSLTESATSPFHAEPEQRGLRVTYPPSIASHSREQDFYFGPDLLLRRHDYHLDASSGFAASQYS